MRVLGKRNTLANRCHQRTSSQWILPFGRDNNALVNKMAEVIHTDIVQMPIERQAWPQSEQTANIQDRLAAGVDNISANKIFGEWTITEMDNIFTYHERSTEVNNTPER